MSVRKLIRLVYTISVDYKVWRLQTVDGGSGGAGGERRELGHSRSERIASGTIGGARHWWAAVARGREVGEWGGRGREVGEWGGKHKPYI